MKDYDDMQYNDTAEKLVDILCQKTQNSNRLFFRVLVAYYFAKVASMMRAKMKTHDRGELPVNLYAINLALSGQGKGHSTNIIEEQVINQFRQRFLDETMHSVSERNLVTIANHRAAKKDGDPDDEIDRVKKEYDTLGELAFSFDSGTTAAVKQMRHKLLMANAGSMNMEIDEIGSNLLGNIDVLTTFLELYDVGKVKQKLTKNTAENTRSAEIEGRTPTNMMLFGTPPKLLDGGKTEEEFLSMLETGFARRCLFGYQTASAKMEDLTREEIYDMLTDTNSNAFMEDLSDSFYELADMVNFNKTLNISKDVSLLVIEYRMNCEKASEQLPDHQEIQRAELAHRYFKALKLAGTYAFIDGSADVTEDHLFSAIRLVEDSGKAFGQMLTRDRPYVKLAKYMATIEREITHVDLMEDLPCYKGSENHKREMLIHATAWGYKHNVIIKRSVSDGIEFLRGESLKEVDLEAVKVSYGTKLAEGYGNEEVPFADIATLTQAKGMHWVNHHLKDGYRKEDNIIPGFDMVVIDVDESVSLPMAQMLLKEHTYHIHTTKRHRLLEDDGTQHGDRFRIVLPLTHRVVLEKEDFREFMKNVYEWLPFNVDEATVDRCRKWMTCKGEVHENTGKSLDALLFIPKTRKAEEVNNQIVEMGNLNNMERWFMKNTTEGNRSNNLVRYALMLVDAGQDLDSIKNNVLVLNSKLSDPLEETEIHATIMVTANKAFYEKKSKSKS